jgi:hypothetical protein
MRKWNFVIIVTEERKETHENDGLYDEHSNRKSGLGC